ncbi:MAG: hypothetical protein HYR88_04160 [Verrucomicrobia bacterium]|nr:hypothetical protein [Verrucomicrobiota bacterium]
MNTPDNHSGPEDGLLSLNEALQAAADGDTIRFEIPGPGPHILQTPMGGYPFIRVNGLTLDGYSQPGAAPNSQPFSGTNNAVIQIVLDSSGDDTADSTYPDNPGLTLRRSTRMVFADGSDISGYGDTENGILAVLGAQNFTVRGIGFLGRHTEGEQSDPSIYAVALARGAAGAKVQGCWFGLHPDGKTIEGFRAAVTGFRFRGTVDGVAVELFSSGLVFGVDGDGIQDRAEANITMGMELALGLELPGARISGNRFNVYPDGLTFLDIRAYALEHNLGSIEVFENGRSRENTLIGTDGLGASAADQRNVMAPAHYKRMFEFYGGSPANHVVIAGNLIGVGVDGETAYPFDPIGAPDLMSIDNAGSVRIGSNADGQGDDLEPNVIQGLRGVRLCGASSQVLVTARANRLRQNGFSAFPFAQKDGGRDYTKYYADVLAIDLSSPDLALPVLGDVTDGFLTGSVPAPNRDVYPYSVVDLYLLDPVAKDAGLSVPGVFLGSFVEGSTQDSSPTPDEFRFPISGFKIPDQADIVAVVTYSKSFGRLEAGESVTGPASLAIHPPASEGGSLPPTAFSIRLDAGAVVFSWKSDPGTQRLEATDDLALHRWQPVSGAAEWVAGESKIRIPVTAARAFYRLVSP